MAIIKKNKQTNKKNKQHKLYTKKQKCLKGGGEIPKGSLGGDPPKGFITGSSLKRNGSSVSSVSSGYGSMKGSFSSLGSSSSSKTNTPPKRGQSSSMFGEVPNPNKFKKLVTNVMYRIKNTAKLFSPVLGNSMAFTSTRLTRTHNDTIAKIAKKQRQTEEEEHRAKQKAKFEASRLASKIAIEIERAKQAASPIPPPPSLNTLRRAVSTRQLNPEFETSSSTNNPVLRKFGIHGPASTIRRTRNRVVPLTPTKIDFRMLSAEANQRRFSNRMANEAKAKQTYYNTLSAKRKAELNAQRAKKTLEELGEKPNIYAELLSSIEAQKLLLGNTQQTLTSSPLQTSTTTKNPKTMSLVKQREELQQRTANTGLEDMLIRAQISELNRRIQKMERQPKNENVIV